MTVEKDSDTDFEFVNTTDKNPSNILPEKLTLDSPLQFECHPQH